jgi:hypothetical protein
MGNEQRKTLVFLTALGLLTACTSSPEDKPPVAEKPAVVPRQEVISAEEAPCLLPVYDLALLSKSKKTSPGARLSTDRVGKLSKQYPGLPAVFRTYDDYQELYALDTLRCKHFMLVAFLSRYEDCCEDVYFLTFTPGGQKLISWARTAKTGNDGTWNAKAAMRLKADGRLHVTTLTNDGAGDDVTTWRDSVTTAFTATADGHLTHSRLDSTRATSTATK